MQCLITECTTLPSEAVDTILAQFLRADPKTSAFFSGRSGAITTSEEKPPASYTIAAMICTSCAERMSLYVAQYFSSVIVDAASLDGAKPKSKRRTSSSNDEEDLEQGPSEEDLKELDKAHRLLRELWRASPRVLQNVIPQLESELQTENEHLRTLATETIGDMAAGIGAAALTLPPPADPAAYPPKELVSIEEPARAPEKFSRANAAVYSRFLSRQNDKSPPIRAIWTAAVGRILITNAGGLGLNSSEEKELVQSLSRMLVDSDEKVRITAIQSIGQFDLKGIVSRIGAYGGLNQDDSLLKNLADRVREKKHAVRVEAVTVLGRIWAMAAGEIAAGNAEIKELLGEIPSKIFDAYYINEKDIHAMIDQVLFDFFMPVAYPATKRKGQTAGEESSTLTPEEADKVRVERLLVLFAGLNQRAKPVFLRLLARPLTLQSYVSMLLKRCEDYNGGVVEENGPEIKQHLARLINYFAKETPDAQRASEDFWKFAKLHDLRAYKLIRFCISPDSDYKKIHNSMKELKKRLDNANFPSTSADTILTFVRRVANLYFNKSHIQPIITFTQTDKSGLAPAANDLLMELTSKNPSAFKSHAEELCQALVDQAPSSTRDNGPTALDALKACAPFAKKYPNDMPKDRKFFNAMRQYALRGTPSAAAKYAVSILMSCGDKKEMYALELLQKCTDGYEYGMGDFLSKLACLSQLMATSAQELEDNLDPVVDIAINQTLLQFRTPADDQPQWESQIDEECEAKLWAIKILVNRIRPYTDAEAARDIAKPVYQLLTTLITKKGELSKRTPTPESHKSRLRLQAALSLLKLSTNRAFDAFLTPAHFVQLALVAQDEVHPVREAFMRKLKKYLGQDRLASRFYTITFLLAFEPSTRLREETLVWLRARARTLARTPGRMLLETVFARFLSLLAHHPDFAPSAADLADFARYILFYLRAVASEENLGFVYHVAQRVKGVADGLDAETSDRLYMLSDLAQAVVRCYEEARGWSMQAYGGKVALPAGIFVALPNHEVAQEIASRTYLPVELTEEGMIEDIVKADLKAGKANGRKRRSHEGRAGLGDRERPRKMRKGEANSSAKRSGASAIAKAGIKTPKKGGRRSAASMDDDDENSDGDDFGTGADNSVTRSASRRRSARASGAHGKNYAESSDDDADAIDEQAVAEPQVSRHSEVEDVEMLEANVAEDEDDDNDAANAQLHAEADDSDNDIIVQQEPRSDDTRDEGSEKENSKKGNSGTAKAQKKTKTKQGTLPFKKASGHDAVLAKSGAKHTAAADATAEAAPAVSANGRLRRTARGR